MRLVLLSLFAFAAFAQTSTDTSNGNLIPEPSLADYDHANRSPGILAQPSDIIDQNGNSAQF